MLERIISLLAKIPGGRAAWRQLPVGSVGLRVRHGIWTRPHYAYGVHAAARLARDLGLPGVTVAELGVAGGSGLVNMERTAAEISAKMGIPIDVVGFDGGQGMPSPIDYRDLPYVWKQGFYKMDVDKLRARLKGAQLILGDVATTARQWEQQARYPLGFVAFDLDYYSSTRDAFALFNGEAQHHLPRVYCYFDDIIWPEHACHNEFTGELLAIREFNEQHESRKIAPLHLLRHQLAHPFAWADQIYVMHNFVHPLYSRNLTPDGLRHTQHPLAG